jgi:hypothetical protein
VRSHYEAQAKEECSQIFLGDASLHSVTFTIFNGQVTRSFDSVRSECIHILLLSPTMCKGVRMNIMACFEFFEPSKSANMFFYFRRSLQSSIYHYSKRGTPGMGYCVRADSQRHCQVVETTRQFVKRQLEKVPRDSSHDWWHIERVHAMAVTLSKKEGLGGEALLAVEMAALLHDVQDWKYATTSTQEFSVKVQCNTIKQLYTVLLP